MLAAPLASWLHSRGANIRLAVVIGVTMSTLGLTSMALAQDDVIVSLAIYAVLMGAGSTLIANLPYYLVGDFFPREHPRHVLATGIVLCGHSMGQ